VTTERASAVRRLTAAEATATQAFEEVGEMRDELADLRERLAQVPGPARPRATPAGVGGRAGGATICSRQQALRMRNGPWPCSGT